jgi:hypothetical protein
VNSRREFLMFMQWTMFILKKNSKNF